MSSHVPIPLTFTLLDSVGDSAFVLVLVEATSTILNYWQEIKTYYLPFLLEAVGPGSKSRHVRVCWQLTSDIPGQSSIETQGQIPDFPFSPSINAPITLATLRRGLETIKSAPREQGWTRHLIIIGVSPPLPSEVAGNRHEPNMLSETHQAMAAALSEERIRMHMVLSAAHYMQPLRDLHDLLLRHQHSAALPPWFQYDASRYTIHLSPQPLLHDSAMGRFTRSNLAGAERPIPVPSPSSRSPTQPLSSPVHEAPTHPLSPSPPSKRTRFKPKDSGSPPSPSSSAGGPVGLVSFLQKAHGLSKKRASSSKVTKRTSVNEPSRPSTSSRPILPKLTLPQQASVITRPAEGMPKIAAHLEVASAVPSPASVSAYIATASDSIAAHREPSGSGLVEDRYPPGRWPFLKILPMSGAHEGPGFGEGASAALRSLEALPPIHPTVGMRLPGEQGSPPQSALGVYTNMPHAVEPVTHHATYGAYDSGSSPHTKTLHSGYPTSSGYIMTSSSPTYAPPPGPPPGVPSRMPRSNMMPSDMSPQLQGSSPSQIDSYPNPLHPGALSRGSPILQSGAHVTRSYESYGYPQQMTAMHPYGVSPTTSQTSTPLPSPSITAPVGRVDEGEDQPFIVTPEYEAFANARFEEAIRSGAMQASMTPAALSPGLTRGLSSGPSNEYFPGQVVSQADHVIAPASGLQQTAILSQQNYAYTGGQHQQHHNGHGHPIYQQSPTGTTMATPGSAQYYPTAGTPPPGSNWYGS